jgi:hypothetical protein
MDNQTVKTNTTLKGLRFLLAPEDSSSTPSGSAPPPCGVIRWNHAKTGFWFVSSVLAALLIGQL